ncbi:chromate transporter [Alkalilacustris brevis]|uniref:chromate transporter n=1 Tax=Alkalilacustris brevis TaxID=2026338 RepID=UPI000E0DCDD2|nr:chromate transporter [Alkalilacustris brevis]
MPETERTGPANRSISPLEMLRCWGYIGATGFGGVLPMAYHELIERRKWLTVTEFTEILAMCQVLPGPNVVNFAVVFGMRGAGLRGAAASLVGLMAFPICIVLSLATLYAGFSDVEAVRNAFRAVAAAAAGLISAVTAKLLWPVITQARAMTVVVLAVAAIAVLSLPLVLVIFTLGPLSVFLAYLAGRRRHD